MNAFSKAMLCLLLLMGASCVLAATIGMDGQEPRGYREQGILPDGSSGDGSWASTDEPARLWRSGLAMTDNGVFDLDKVSRLAWRASGGNSGPRPDIASMPAPGALWLFVTAMIGAGVINRKKRREQKHEALAS